MHMSGWSAQLLQVIHLYEWLSVVEEGPRAAVAKMCGGAHIVSRLVLSFEGVEIFVNGWRLFEPSVACRYGWWT